MLEFNHLFTFRMLARFLKTKEYLCISLGENRDFMLVVIKARRQMASSRLIEKMSSLGWDEKKAKRTHSEIKK